MNLSFASSVIIELKDINENSFFLDPYRKNKSFIDYYYNSINLVINTYEQLVEITSELDYKKKSIKEYKKTNVCLDSNHVSEIIYKALK